MSTLRYAVPQGPTPTLQLSRIIRPPTGPTSLTLTPATETDTAQAIDFTAGSQIKVGVALAGASNTSQVARQVPAAPRQEPKDPVPGVFVFVYSAPPIFNVIVPGGTNQGYKFGAVPPIAAVSVMGSRIVLSRVASGPQQFTLTPATETDTAVALSLTYLKTLVSATETDAAQALSVQKSVTLTPATETDSAQTIIAQKFATLTPATEVDAAQALTAFKSVTVTPATETDSAQAITRGGTVTLTPATETDSAQALSLTYVKTVTPAAETDTAQSVSRQKIATLTAAVETDTAQPVTFAVFRSLTPAGETDTAVTLSVSGAAHFLTLTSATETDLALSLGWAPIPRNVDQSTAVTALVESGAASTSNVN